MFKSNVLLMLVLYFFLKTNQTYFLVYPYKTLALKNIFLLHCKVRVAYFILKSRPDVRVVFCLNCR